MMTTIEVSRFSPVRTSRFRRTAESPIFGSGRSAGGSVSAGEAVLTSGQDRIFPKDLPVGTVVEATADRKSPFMKIRVKPAAHLDRLEEVLVLLTRNELEMKKAADPSSEASPAPANAAKAPAKTQ